MSPNFFIIGAAKCGTTALYHFLREHPQVFMPHSETDFWRHKEPHHFAPDLNISPWVSEPNREAYLDLFATSGAAVRVGEASAWHLYSKDAPKLIHAFAPEAKVIVMLRNPVDWMRSWHHDCLQWGHETIASFERALEAEPDRREGQRIPRAGGYRGCLEYRAAARFSEQLERYLSVFRPDQINVFLQEDLHSSPVETFTEIANFLGIEASHEPTFRKHNRSRVLPFTHLAETRIRRAMESTASRRAIGNAISRFTPNLLKQGYGKIVSQLPPISNNLIEPALRERLEDEFRGEIEKLSAMLGRDLSHWSSAPRPARAEPSTPPNAKPVSV